MSLPDMDPEVLAGGKVVRTFRMPVDLVRTLGREATQRSLDLTALVLRVLHGYLTYFALPEAAIAQLEADREALKMDRPQYFAHILYHRCLTIRERGLAHDDPRGPSVPAETPAPEAAPPTDRPLGTLGGGAHGAAPGLVPGGGVWPWGVKENQPRKR